MTNCPSLNPIQASPHAAVHDCPNQYGFSRRRSKTTRSGRCVSVLLAMCVHSTSQQLVYKFPAPPPDPFVIAANYKHVCAMPENSTAQVFPSADLRQAPVPEAERPVNLPTSEPRNNRRKGDIPSGH